MCKIGTAISKEKYIERVLNTIKNENLPYEYIGMSNTFIGVKTKIKLYCKAHDYYFEITLNNFFCGKRCAKCKNAYRYNETERIEQVLNRINNEDLHYSFLGLVDDYKNQYSKFKLHCDDCGYEWNVSFGKFLNKQTKCPSCQKNPRYTKEQRENQILQIIQNENLNYDYLGFDSEYVDSGTNIILRCNTHCHIWTLNINEFVNQHHRCPLCKIKSKGEIEVESILKQNYIEYIREYRFGDCKYKKELPFDFYLPNNNICIEYDGEQHFKPITFGGISESEAEINYQETLIKDNLKTEYCKNHNIKLIRIKYNYSKEQIKEILSANI